MPRRSTQQIIADAEALADRFEQDGPDPADMRDATSLRNVHQAFQRVAFAERELTDAVIVARADGFSWAMIGSMMGTTREAARQRYGPAVNDAGREQTTPADGAAEGASARGRLAG